MKPTCLEIDVPTALAEVAAALAWGEGVQGVEVRDAEVEPGAPIDRVRVRIWLPAAAAAEAGARLEAALPGSRVEALAISWRPEVPAPLAVGARWLLCAEAPPETDRTVILLAPGEAFGGGAHATTRLCLRALEALPLPLGAALDVGSGTGVLAIAAAALGAAPVEAVDVDPLSRAATARNARRNGFAIECEAAIPPGRRFDLVIANIYPTVLRRLAPAIRGALAPGGALVLGGLRVGDPQGALAAYRGLRPERRLDEDGWASVTLRAPN